jgi:hypothetical protein
MDELGTTKVYLEILQKRIEELSHIEQNSPFAEICISHINLELEKIIKFLKP